MERDCGTGGNAAHSFGTAEVARIVGLSPSRVRDLARRGVCRAARNGRSFRFSFVDILAVRAARDLLLAKIPARRVLRALRIVSGGDSPASPPRVYADGNHVVVREGRAAWQVDTGQGVFVFPPRKPHSAPTALPAIRPQRARAPEAEAVDWFEYGLWLEGSDRRAAAQAYERALGLDARLADAYVNLGRLRHEDGLADEAIALYREALRIEPCDPVAHYNLALVLEDRGDHAGACAAYRSALRADPNFADAHFNLGRLLERLARRREAIRHFLAYRRLSGK